MPAMPSVAELLAALPSDEDTLAAGELPEELRRLYDALARRPVPTGSLPRFWHLGGFHARVGLAYLAYWLRSWFQTRDRRQQQLLETHLRAAIKLLETMGYLRGAVMKAGQLLASMPEIVPDEFVETLSRLHFQAPPMHYALIREQLIDELGGEPTEVFAEFETEAFAAASLGQVHRGRLKSGEVVAIKIQYPGIARTIRADFRNLAMLMAPLRLTRDWESVKQQFAQLQASFERETDYEQEAAFQNEVRRLFGEDEGIVVPRLFPQYSTRRVLTMQYLDGLTIDQFLAGDPPQAERDAYLAKIFRATARVFYHRRFYTDPHPGNFLFLADGRLGFIDFGGLRPFQDDDWDYLRQNQAAQQGTQEDVLSYVQRSLQFSDQEMQKHAEYVEVIREGFYYYLEPHLTDGRFDYGDADYLRRGVDWLRRAARFRRMKQHPINVFFHRQNFQAAALGYRLRGAVDLRKIIDEEIQVTGWDFWRPRE